MINEGSNQTAMNKHEDVKLTIDNIESWVKTLKPPTFVPSGSAVFNLDLGRGKLITVIRNDMLAEDVAVLSPKLYEQLYNYFNKLTDDKA